MKKQLKTLLCAGLLALTCGAGALRADGQTLIRNGREQGTVRQVIDDRLTAETLGKMLRDMGYDPKVSTSADKSITFYKLVLERDNFTYVIDVSLDKAQKRVWLVCALKRVGAIEQVQAARLQKLLEENDMIAPAAFSYDKTRKQFFLNVAVDNRGITAAQLRAELDTLQSVVRRTYPLWNTATWTEVPGTIPNPIPNPMPVPAGPGKFEAPMKQYVAKVQQAARFLSTVEDGDSAQTAAASLKIVVAQMEKQIEEFKKLGKPTKAEDDELSKKYGAALKAAKEQLKQQMARVAAIPAAKKELQEAFQGFAKVEALVAAAL
jgi:hypothetical protein